MTKKGKTVRKLFYDVDYESYEKKAIRDLKDLLKKERV